MRAKRNRGRILTRQTTRSRSLVWKDFLIKPNCNTGSLNVEKHVKRILGVLDQEGCRSSKTWLAE